jgi:HK97 gp10 family phage protein
MTFKVTGMQELEKVLSELGSRAGKKALVGSLRDAAKPVRKAMRSLAPKDRGNLRKSIKTVVVAGKGSTSNVATAMVGTFKSKNGRYNPGFYSRFIEFGTKAHGIPSETVGRGENKRKNRAKVAFGGKVYGSVNHPGQRAKPFIGPAFDRTHKQATQILSYRLRERIILEVIKKYGRNFN